MGRLPGPPGSRADRPSGDQRPQLLRPLLLQSASSSGEFSAIFGFGEYPNLGVKDAFIDVRRGDRQHIVRSSGPLLDRADTSVGPFRVEVVEPLRSLRVIVEESEHSVAMDVTFTGRPRPSPSPASSSA